MQKYFNSVTNSRGDAILGARVAVSLPSGSLATIYSDNGVTVQTNPMTTDGNGYFAFYAADGRYDLRITAVGIKPVILNDILLEDIGNQLTDFEERVYPGVYESPPLTRPSGAVCVEGDRCTILVAGIGYEHLRSGGTWVIPNIDAVTLALPTGATGVGAIAPFGSAVARTLGDIEGASTLDVGTPRDGSTLADTAFAKLAAECDTGKARWFKVENWKTNYRVSTPVVFNNPGVRIFGDQGATYNRNSVKTGWIEGVSGTVRIFDLGNSRTTGNLADNWQLDGISLRQATGAPTRSIDGVAFTSRTNGPDRGAVIRSASFIRLKDAIVVENADLETSLANLNIDSCVFEGCGSIVNAKGNLLGLRFVGNQAEQNAGSADGLIRGSLNGCVTIEDNMLEGQANTVSIDIPPLTGGRPHVSFKANYLELNSGSYVLRYRVSSSLCSLTVGPNYVTNVQADDYVLFEGGNGRSFVRIYDPFPVVWKNSSVGLKYGSTIFSGINRAYGIRQMQSGKEPAIMVTDFIGLTDPDGSHAHASAPAGTNGMTPYGYRPVVTGNTFIRLPLSVVAGDLAVVNILCRAKEVAAGSLTPQIFNLASTVDLAEIPPSVFALESQGRWVLLSLPFISKGTSSEILVRLFSSTGNYNRAIAGVSGKNYGSFANDGLSKVLIEPSTPNLQ